MGGFFSSIANLFRSEEVAAQNQRLTVYGSDSRKLVSGGLEIPAEQLDDGRKQVYVKVFDRSYLHQDKSEYLEEKLKGFNNQANFNLVRSYLIQHGVGKAYIEGHPSLDTLVITAYTGNDLFLELNGALNAGKLTDEQQSFTKVLYRFIFRASQSRRGRLPTVLYRKVQVTDEGSLAYFDHVGKKVSFHTFVSTTTKQDALKNWLGNLLFVIEVNDSVLAADIHEHSQFPEEAEVLLAPNQLFKIHKVEKAELPDGKIFSTCTLVCLGT